MPIDFNQKPYCCITELNYITPMENVKSIFEHGILSYNRAKSFPHKDISFTKTQAFRDKKNIPKDLVSGSITIHDCVNLYFNGFNAMLLNDNLKYIHEDLCILRIFREAIKLPEAIVTNKNAAIKDAKFFKAKEGIKSLNFEDIFDTEWHSNEDGNADYIKTAKFAELLIPQGKLHPSFIGGVYVSSQKSAEAFKLIFQNDSPVECYITSFDPHNSCFWDLPKLKNKTFDTPMLNPEKLNFFIPQAKEKTKSVQPVSTVTKKRKIDPTLPKGQRKLSVFFIKKLKGDEIDTK